MPTIKYSWALDYKPTDNNRTGHNLFLKTLPQCDWKNRNGKYISKRKVPKTMKEFAKLTKPLQAHIYGQFAKRARNEKGDFFYNETFHQYKLIFERKI